MASLHRVPPGPRGYPLLGSLPAFFRRPLEHYRELSNDYGPIAHAKMGPHSMYMVGDPTLVEELLVGQHKACRKDFITRAVIPLVGYGLLTNEGESWKTQRKLASPPLQPKRIASYADTMVSCTERACESYGEGELRNFHDDIMALTLEIVGKTLLGVNTREEAGRIAALIEAMVGHFEDTLFSWKSLLPDQLPLASTRRFERAKRELDGIVANIIERSRRDAASADHLLARLMKARSDRGERMSEQQLHDEAITMLIAGHETTALTLLYAVYLLARHPQASSRLRLELDTQIGARPISSHDLERLPYLDAVIREALRLYPPAYAFGREVETAFELGGYTLPAGSQIVVSPYGIHRNPRYFPDPDGFMPERWLGQEARALPRMAFLPFGGGPRICIGSHFAMMEAALVLATLVQRLDLEVPRSFELELAPVITLRAKDGLPVRVRRRVEPVAAHAVGA
jgi:cytochrome P450